MAEGAGRASSLCNGERGALIVAIVVTAGAPVAGMALFVEALAVACTAALVAAKAAVEAVGMLKLGTATAAGPVGEEGALVLFALSAYFL